MAFNTACHEDFPKTLFTATIPTLQHIHESGKLIGIITATTRFSFEHDLASHNISRKLIDYSQTADDTSYHKPNPLVFEAAIGAGFNFIGVQTGLVTAEEFAAKKSASIQSIADLLPSLS